MPLDPKKAKELEQGINQGVIAPFNEEDVAKGVLDLSQFPIVAPDSNIDPFMSDFDDQFTKTFDTLGCNIFASVGSTEIYLNAMGGDPDYNSEALNKVELSEREVCVEAGLNGSGGSSEQMWEDAINKLGAVKHDDWPWTPDITKEEFFMALPIDVKAKSLKFLKKYKPYHRPVGIDVASIKEALKYGAVKVFLGTGANWNLGEPNVIPKTLNPMGHAVLVRKISDLGIHIRDHYPPYVKVLAPDYIIYFAYQTLYKKITPFHHLFTKQLEYGMVDPECIMLQTALYNDGDFEDSTKYNQRFGNLTQAAVQKFQVKYGIADSTTPGYGRCGPKTIKKLNELYGS